ncbi:MAG: CPBP family intramembrane metalloprotease [Anaerolineae bacterium]|nr:CPBP family intramembrane metalloprotease [Anaerolineae bacterium]
MDPELLFSTVIAVAILGAVVVAANYADKRRDRRLRQWVFGVLLLMNLSLMGLYGLIPLADGGSDLSPDEAAGGLILSGLVGVASTALLFEGVRERIARFFPARKARRELGDYAAIPAPGARNGSPAEPLFPQMLNYYTTATRENPAAHAAAAQATAKPGFDPRSTVHAVALVFIVYLLGTQFISFVLEGGLAGVAAGFAEGLTAWDLVLNGLPLIVIPVLGVGLGVRRTLPQALARLGIGGLSLRGLGVAAAVTVALLILVSVVGSTWQLLVPPETFEEQTQASEALADSVTTVWLALVLAASAAISEEIAFRGALQPIFGFWPTAIIFALTHMQYALTPATLIILGVAVAFGWIRMRYNTTVAMVTHFLYNFIPLALNVAIGTEALHWLHGLGFGL